MNSFRALRLYKSEALFSASIDNLSATDLPQAGELLVRVGYSCVNYKDALAISGQGSIVRSNYPFVPGIDLAGTILESSDPRFTEGDRVVCTGGGLGENQWGGLSEVQRISSKWVVAIPEQFSVFDAMVIGTAGVTAMLAVIALEDSGVRADQGEVLVTGATGGVGTLALKLLANKGFQAVACTGKRDAHDYLRKVGASRIIDRSDFTGTTGHAMESAKWAGAIDTVGSQTLSKIISQIARHGAVSVCGLAGGSDLHTTVFPFILRGIKLLGIDSNTCPVPVRERVWSRLADELSPDFLQKIASEIELDEVIVLADSFIKGKIKGRYVVQLSNER